MPAPSITRLGCQRLSGPRPFTLNRCFDKLVCTLSRSTLRSGHWGGPTSAMLFPRIQGSDLVADANTPRHSRRPMAPREAPTDEVMKSSRSSSPELMWPRGDSPAISLGSEPTSEAQQPAHGPPESRGSQAGSSIRKGKRPEKQPRKKGKRGITEALKDAGQGPPAIRAPANPTMKSEPASHAMETSATGTTPKFHVEHLPETSGEQESFADVVQDVGHLLERIPSPKSRPWNVAAPNTGEAQGDDTTLLIQSGVAPTPRERLFLVVTPGSSGTGTGVAFLCKMCDVSFDTWIHFRRHCRASEVHPTQLHFCARCYRPYPRPDSCTRHADKVAGSGKCTPLPPQDASDKIAVEMALVRMYEAHLMPKLRQGTERELESYGEWIKRIRKICLLELSSNHNVICDRRFRSVRRPMLFASLQAGTLASRVS
ncbi:hypothetical protein BC834DRAFT_885926 [Gloeopeniophorella convolvens]|nr:hypothetical protein BC834DRAFT_885926 [Gloeopeniophorella convolvens]